MTRTSRLDNLRAAAERRELARAAHGAVRIAYDRVRAGRDDYAMTAWHDAIDRADALRAACYPRGFWASLEDLKRSPAHTSSIEIAIQFLEEDAMFCRSGYGKALTIRRLLRQPLDLDQVERLGDVVIAVVDRRASQEFRRYCRLAVRVATPRIRTALEARLHGEDEKTGRRASWVLAAMQMSVF